MLGVLALVGAVSGCGDLADGAGSDRATDSDADAEFSTGGPQTSGGPQTPGADTGDASSGAPGDSTGGGADTSTEDACDLDCDNGWCDPGDEGPTCGCDDGYVSVGLGCIACTTVVGELLDPVVPAVAATFEYTLNGETPPDSTYEFGDISLRNRTSGDLVPVGRSNAQQTTVLMVPGTYDVLYRYREGQTLPENTSAVLQTIEVGAAASTYTIGIQTASVRGAIRYEGADAPANDAYDFGRLWLVNRSSGDRIKLGDTRDESYALDVVPGEYDVHYELRESTGEAPINPDGYITSIQVIAEQDNLADIVVDTVEVSGDILFDGAVIDNQYDSGDLEIRDVLTGDRFGLANTESGAYAAVLLAGTYEVLYTSRERQGSTPANVEAVVATLVLGDPPKDGDDDRHLQDIAMETVLVSGSFELGGALPPTDEFDDGIVSLRGKSGDTVTLGNTHDGTFSQRVLAGSYEVFYSQETASLSMPVNTNAVVGSLDLDTDTPSAVIDIEVIEVFGTLTLGGEPAPDSSYDDGRLSLRNAQTGDTVVLGNTRWGTYAARVVPGTYDILYANEFSETQLPVNGGAVLASGVVVSAETSNIDIDVPVSNLSGTITIEGSDPSIDEGLGQLFLRDVRTGDAVFIGHTGQASFTKPLTDGIYLMEYRGIAAEGAVLGTSLPANANAAFACYEIISE